MAARFEYQVVPIGPIPKSKATKQDQYAQQINQVAAYGWRLLAISDEPQWGNMRFGYFERPVSGE